MFIFSIHTIFNTYIHKLPAMLQKRLLLHYFLKHGNHHETNHQTRNAPRIHTFGSPLTHFVFFLRFLFVCGWRGRGRFLLLPPPFTRPLLPCCTVISIRKGTFLDTVTGCKLFYLLYNKCFRWTIVSRVRSHVHQRFWLARMLQCSSIERDMSKNDVSISIEQWDEQCNAMCP